VPVRASARDRIETVTEAELKELLREIRDEMRLKREEHRLNRLEHKRNQARFQNSQAVMREMVLELREGRAIFKDIQDGIRANTEGLLRVLDELRRDDGPSPAGA
jgi:hypothetical protein